MYWGPGESGKTTNYLRLLEEYRSHKASKGYSIDTTDGRTLWHDSVVIAFDMKTELNNYNISVRIITCTGQERFLSTREYVLEDADGVIFVGDSHLSKLEENKRSFRELRGFIIDKEIPYIVQLNKQDLEDAIDVMDFKKSLGLPEFEIYPDGRRVVYPAVAIKGINISECFEELLYRVLLPMTNSQNNIAHALK